jgi:TonB-linked SusC/RagA family outer membrane protein
MVHLTCVKLGLLTVAFVAMLGVGAPPVSAQGTGTVSGQVTDARTQRPLSGVQVSIVGSGRRAVTDASGTYSLPSVAPGSARVRAEMIGYTAVERNTAVTAGATADVDFQLGSSAVALDELVVTGTAGETQRRAVGNAVTSVNAAEITQIAAVQNVHGLINGRSPGVAVLPGTGIVGSGARIRVRGGSSISLSNEPLIYVDGIRVDNAQGTGPQVQNFGSGVISRLNDFNPEDIESIEIIKGPAAATLYGTEASNGVIQIITKKGNIGKPAFNFLVRQGANWFANYEDRIWTNFWRNPRTGQVESLNLAESEAARGTPLFRTGHLQNYSLNVSGGTEGVRYYLGGDFDREEGVEPDNRLNRFSGRANLTIFPVEGVDITASMGYTGGRTYLSDEAGNGGVTWGSYFSTPQFLNENLDLTRNPPRRGFRSFVSELYWESEDFQDVGRFTGSIQLNHRPASWFTHRLSLGTDEVREDNQSITQRTPLLLQFSPTAVGGKTVARRDVSYNSLDYSGTFNRDLREGLGSQTSLGAQYYRRFTRFVTASGRNFVLPGLRAVSATGERNASESYVENVTVGVFAQQQFSWQDRIFVTAAVRADDNSAFGENFDLVYYPKASATWVVSEEPFWSVGFLPTLRLRAAYGQSGQQPAAFAALRTFDAALGAGDVTTITPRDAGNPDLGPERGEELEFGMDAGFFDDRLGVELTGYRGRTLDAILTRQAAPSQGFPGLQFVNVGEVARSGFEATLRGQALATRRATLDMNFTFATNNTEVKDLGANPSVVESATFGVEHRVGYPLGSWFHVKVVDAKLDANGRFVRSSLVCDNGQGGTVPCYTGSALTAPRVYLGRTIPKYEGGFSSTLTLFDRLRIYGLVDYKTGHRKWDHNLRVRCSLFNICRENVLPLEYDPVTVAAYQNGGTFGSTYINDASFAKLRELSASYTLPGAWSRQFGASGASLTVAGRNLYTWTRYSGMEPEAMYLSGDRGGFAQVEQNNLPQLTQFVTTINLTF